MLILLIFGAKFILMIETKILPILKNIKIMFPAFFFVCLFFAKLYVLMINLVNQLLFKQKTFSQQLY